MLGNVVVAILNSRKYVVLEASLIHFDPGLGTPLAYVVSFAGHNLAGEESADTVQAVQLLLGVGEVREIGVHGFLLWLIRIVWHKKRALARPLTFRHKRLSSFERSRLKRPRKRKIRIKTRIKKKRVKKRSQKRRKGRTLMRRNQSHLSIEKPTKGNLPRIKRRRSRKTRLLQPIK